MVLTLYHGSDVEVAVPAIRQPNRALDFGVGFYTTLNLEQAKAFARKVRERNRSAYAIVSVYTVDFEALTNETCIRTFDAPNEEWLDFVSANRAGETPDENCDAVFGPVANDSIFKTFIAYQSGVLTKEETITRLKVHPLYNQLTFKTLRALSLLHFDHSFLLKEGEA